MLGENIIYYIVFVENSNHKKASYCCLTYFNNLINS